MSPTVGTIGERTGEGKLSHMAATGHSKFSCRSPLLTHWPKRPNVNDLSNTSLKEFKLKFKPSFEEIAHNSGTANGRSKMM